MWHLTQQHDLSIGTATANADVASEDGNDGKSADGDGPVSGQGKDQDTTFGRVQHIDQVVRSDGHAFRS